MKGEALAAFVLQLVASLTNGKCIDDKSCSFNGVCSTDGKTCECDSGWTGQYCESLDLLPARNGSGLSSMLHGKSKTSTWGGSAIYSPLDNKYHMWFAEMARHCGVHRWISNSIVSHAVSDGPGEHWKFHKTGESFGLFTHEPIVAYDATSKDYVVFVTHWDGPATDGAVCNCVDGSSPSSPDSRCHYEEGFGQNKTTYSYFSYSKRPTHDDGSWSKLISLASVQPEINHTDLNLAPIILANHSLVAWTRWDIWRATDWRNISTYVDDGQAPDWDDPNGQWEGEDPSMWIDRKGRYHIISHNGQRDGQGRRKDNLKDDPSKDCGRHLFSETGRAGTWITAPLELGGCAYPRLNVTFEDGNNYSFRRRERPHLILGPDGFTPVALSTSVIDCPLDDVSPPYYDGSYTLVQPIRTRTTPNRTSMLRPNNIVAESKRKT